MEDLPELSCLRRVSFPRRRRQNGIYMQTNLQPLMFCSFDPSLTDRELWFLGLDPRLRGIRAWSPGALQTHINYHAQHGQQEERLARKRRREENLRGDRVERKYDQAG